MNESMPGHAARPDTEPTVAVAIFVKTPGYSPIKTRLAAELGRAPAEEFHLRSAAATAAVVDAVAATQPVRRVWAVAEQAAMDDLSWAGRPRLWQGDGGLGTRLHHVYDTLQAWHSGVILLGADAPFLSPGVLGEAVARVRNGSPDAFVIGPAADGGFYLFGGTPALPRTLWESVPYSAESTRTALEAQLRHIGSIHHLSPSTDIDTLAEFRQYASAPPSDEWLVEQRQLWQWMRSI